MSARPPRDRTEARLLAFALKAYGRLGDVDAGWAERPEQVEAACPLGTDPEARVLHWTWRSAESLGLPQAWRQAHRRQGLLFLMVILLGACMGVGLLTGAGLLSAAEHLNVYAVWLALIGLHTVFLLIWALNSWLLWLPSRIQPAVNLRLPGLVTGALAWLKPSPCDRAALETEYHWSVGSVVRPWGGAVYIHAYWLSALSAAWLGLLAWLAVEEVNFTWETTLLGATHFSTLTANLAWLPAQFGFPVPSPDQVAASTQSELTAVAAAEAAALRKVWAGFLLGSILIYAWLPRALVLLACLWLWMARRRRFRLDLADPEYARFLARPLTHHSPAVIIDVAESAAVMRLERPLPLLPPRALVEPEGAFIGLELQGRVAWPPVSNTAHQDLGSIDDASPARLPEPARRLGPLTICVAASRAPDRGSLRWLSELRAAWPGPCRLWVMDRARAARRLDAPALNARLQAWAATAAEAGVDQTWVDDADIGTDRLQV